MKIIINKKWQIETDSLNWAVGNPSVDNKTGKARLNNLTYHSTLGSALIWCFNRRLMEESESMILNHLQIADKEIREAKLVKLINKIKDEIVSAVGGK